MASPWFLQLLIVLWQSTSILTQSIPRVAAGQRHSLFLKSNGTVWASGFNKDGQLGTGDTVDRLSPQLVFTDVEHIAAGYYQSLFVKSDGTAWAAGYNAPGSLGDGTTID